MRVTVAKELLGGLDEDWQWIGIKSNEERKGKKSKEERGSLRQGFHDGDSISSP